MNSMANGRTSMTTQASSTQDIAKHFGNTYGSEAYGFAAEALNHAVHRSQSQGHVKGAEVAVAFVALAQKAFGLFAPQVLSHWGVNTTEDVGRIVFQLVEYGILQANDDDTMDDFRELFDLQDAVRQTYTGPRIDPDRLARSVDLGV